MPMQSKQINFNGQNIFIGIDVHLKSWNVSIVVSDVKTETFSQSPLASVLKKHLDKSYPGGNYLSAYEAGFTGFSTHYALLSEGINNIVFNAADIKESQKERVRKNDSIDSAKIARNLSKGDLEAIYVPSLSAIADRSIYRTRGSQVKSCTRIKGRIRSQLFLNGIAVPPEMEDAKKHWSRKFISWMMDEATRLPYNAGNAIITQIETLQFMHKQVLKTTRELRKLMLTEKYEQRYNLLMSIPGIGTITAAAILLEIGDIDRFKNNDAIAAYVGLIPDTRSSGPNDKPTGITNRSCRYLRSMFIESAWISIRYDPALLLAYSKLKLRMASNKAIVRIARKLLNRTAYVLRNKTAYVKAVV